jgi:1-acyl-sn-glycerol-3-phosphate acyltransferase
MGAVLEQGTSLIIFPEGTRNMTDATLLPFKTGLFHLAAGYPSVELVPVWIDNLNRVLPKGEVVPIPLLCEVRIGAPLHLNDGEDKQAFLDRSRDSLLALANRRSAP